MKFSGIPLLVSLVVMFIVVVGCSSVPPPGETSPVPTGQATITPPEPAASSLTAVQTPESHACTQESLPAGTRI